MDKQKFIEIVGPTVIEIDEDKVNKASEAIRPLAELLFNWYENKLAQEELNKPQEDIQLNVELNQEGGDEAK